MGAFGLVYLASLFFVLGCHQHGTLPDLLSTELEPREYTEPEESTGFWSVRFPSDLPPEGLTLPVSGAEAAHFRYVKVGPGDGLGVLVYVGPSKTDKPANPRLWVDRDGDRRFDDSESITGARVEGAENRDAWLFRVPEVVRGDGEQRFPPFFVKVSAWPGFENPLAERDYESGIEDRSERTYNFYARAMPARYHEGRLRMGGREIAVRLSDVNLDGVYSFPRESKPAVPPFMQARDAMGMDLNGDGRFVSSFELEGTEWFVVGSHIFLFDKLYRVRLDAKGAYLRLEPAAGPKGTLRVNVERASLSVETPTSWLVLQVSGERPLELPVGQYRLNGVLARVRDKGGATWRIVSYLWHDSQRALEVVEGKETRLQLGPPLKLTMNVDPMGTFELDLRDASGFTVVDVRKADGSRPDPPKLRIYDAKGKLLDAERFHYG